MVLRAAAAAAASRRAVGGPPAAVDTMNGLLNKLCRSMVSWRVRQERTNTDLICSKIGPLKTERAVLVRSKGSVRGDIVELT